jgi:hypothetical protein
LILSRSPWVCWDGIAVEPTDSSLKRSFPRRRRASGIALRPWDPQIVTPPARPGCVAPCREVLHRLCGSSSRPRRSPACPLQEGVRRLRQPRPEADCAQCCEEAGPSVQWTWRRSSFLQRCHPGREEIRGGSPISQLAAKEITFVYVHVMISLSLSIHCSCSPSLSASPIFLFHFPLPSLPRSRAGL